jgi:hypothetical protein
MVTVSEIKAGKITDIKLINDIVKVNSKTNQDTFEYDLIF